jgi:hypothetical protein
MAYAIVASITSFIGNMMSPGATRGNPGGLFFGWACGWCMLMLVFFIWAGIMHLGCKIFGGQGSYTGTFRAVSFAAAPTFLLLALSNLLAPVLVPKNLQTSAPAPAAIVAARGRASGVRLAQAGGVPSLPPGRPGSPGAQGQADPTQLALSILTALVPLMLFYVIGYIWSLVLQVVAVGQIHQLGTGQAVGAVFVANVVSWLIGGGLILVFGVMIAGLVAAAGGGR